MVHDADDSDHRDFAPDFGAASLVAHWKRLREQPATSDTTVPLTGVSSTGRAGSLTVQLGEAILTSDGEAITTVEGDVIMTTPPEVALAFALLDIGGRTDEGQLIVAVRPAWIRILEDLERDPHALHKLNPRQTEELVADGWRAHDWQVTLTPRSGDGGVDIIATRSDVGAIRILDQVKRYRPGHLVTAEEVRAMWGVLDADRRASKAYVTTTSRFAPGVHREFADRMPTRIELRDGLALRAWLLEKK